MGLFDKLFPVDNPEETYQQAFEEETKFNDFEKALKLYEKAANRGLAKAQYYCGFMYLKGRGTRRNYQKALYYIQKSANQNYPHGQFLLAQMYLSGEGVAKNEQLGNEWLDKFRHHDLPTNFALHFHNF